MSTNEVERLIWDLHRKGHVDEFTADPAAFVSRYGVTDSEQQALIQRDYGQLYQLGVHPMAVLFFSQVNGTPMPAYLAAIGSPSERVEQFTRLLGRP